MNQTNTTSRRKESVVSIWARRALSIPGYLLFSLLYFAATPLWLPGVLLFDAIKGEARRRPRTRAMCFLALYLSAELGGIFLASVLGIGTLGGRLIGTERYVASNASLQRWWTNLLFWGGVYLFSMKIETEGLELTRQAPFLLFVRHSSLADTVLAAALVANPNRQLLRYVIKQELLWDPCLDLVGRRLPNTFVDRHAPKAQAEIDATAQLAHALDDKSGVLIYPEGTRFDEKKLRRSIAKLHAMGLEELASVAAGYRHVLAPRLGGALALLAAAPKTDLLFLEHSGFEGSAKMTSFWNGALINQTIRVRLRRFAAADIPAEGRDRWLFEQWAEIDEWLHAIEQENIS